MGNYTVRVVQMTAAEKPVNMRDHTGFTKREALTFIDKLGKINVITKMHTPNPTYIVTPTK